MTPYEYGTWTKVTDNNKDSWHKGDYGLTGSIGHLAMLQQSSISYYTVYESGKRVKTCLTSVYSQFSSSVSAWTYPPHYSTLGYRNYYAT